MNRFTKGILTAGAVSLVASFGVATPAQAQTAGMPAKCYRWPVERIDVAWVTGATAHSEQVRVTDGSPCRDVNVRSVRDVDNRKTCRTMRVRWTSGAKTGATTKWRKVCNGWTILAWNATEGDTLVIEGKGRPFSAGYRA